jgi:cytochrome c oxidase subunit II
VRRRRLSAVVLVALAVALATAWFGWGREGLTPVKPATTGAHDINELYAFIGAFAVLILLSVAVPLALIIARYRESGLPREVEGPQVRGNTRLELLWTAIPIVFVVFLCAVTLFKVSGIVDPATAADEDTKLEVQVEGRQFYWRYVYPNGAIAIDRLRVPIDRVVDLTVTAPAEDVVHSFWAPAIGGKVDAIPDKTNHLKFRATKTGVFPGVCAELCGIQHGAMRLEVEVLPTAEFERWQQEHAASQDELGQELFEGVCTKCHFAAPEYAPNIVGNPLLADGGSVRRIVTQGRGRMPAVGRGWTDRELDALVEYTKTLAPQTGDDGS